MKRCIIHFAGLFAALSGFGDPYVFNTTVFSQDFTASSTVGDYIGTGANQLDYISTGSTGTDTISSSITGNRLQFTETGNTDDPGPTAAIGKVTGIDLQGSELVQYAFTMAISDIYGGYNGFASIAFSGANTDDWAAGLADENNTASASFGAVNVRTAAGTAWSFRALNPLVNSANVAEGDSLATLYVIAYAKSGTWGGSVDYTDPTGATSIIAQGEYDLWVDNGSGPVLLGTRETNLSLGEVPNKFKFAYSTVSGLEGDVAFDKIQVSVPVPEPTTMGLTLFSGGAIILLRKLQQ